MKIQEILTEAQMDPGIKEVLTKKGYKFLGKGQDQDAYLAPDGTILKIFGYESGASSYSRSQRSFIDFADFCMKNPNNPFLPNFGGWETFEFNGQRYLQIKCERLFDLDKHGMEKVGEALGIVASLIKNYGVDRGVGKIIDIISDEDHFSQYVGDDAKILITMLGDEKQLMLFVNTIDRLVSIAEQKSYGLDLHSGNFMLGSDGEIVINDPFFTGSFRY